MKYFIASLLAALAAADGHAAACQATLKKYADYIAANVTDGKLKAVESSPDPADPAKQVAWTQAQKDEFSKVVANIQAFATADEITEEALDLAVDTFEGVSWLNAAGEAVELEDLADWPSHESDSGKTFDQECTEQPATVINEFTNLVNAKKILSG